MCTRVWNIDPYKSAGPLQFGMTELRMIQLLSSPESPAPEREVCDREEDVTTLHWMASGLQTVFSGTDGRLTMVSMYSNINSITLGNTSLVWTKSADFSERLSRISGEVYSMAGLRIFPNLGLAVQGLESEDNSTKSVTAFSRGTWDSLIGMMKRLK